MFTVPELRTLLPDALGRETGAIAWIPLTRTDPGDLPSGLSIVDAAWRQAATPPGVIAGTPVRPDCLQGLPAAGGTLTGPAIALQRIDQARPIGFDAVLGGDGALYAAQGMVTAGAGAEALAQRTLGGHHGYVLAQRGDPLMVGVQPRARPERLAQTALFVGALEPANFGSFLLRVLPQLLVLAEARVAHDVIVVPERTPWTLQALDMLGLTGCPVLSVRESAGFCFDTVWMVSNAYQVGAIGPDMQARLRAFAQSCRGAAPFDAQRLYVSRGLQTVTRPNYRTLRNEREIEDRLRPQGFAVILPEVWGFRQQVALFAAAEAVIGPSGSGMLLSAFAPEGARVLDLESYTPSVAQHARLYATTGKQYGFAFGATEDNGTAQERRAWRLDMGLLDDPMAQMQML